MTKTPLQTLIDELEARKEQYTNEHYQSPTEDALEHEYNVIIDRAKQLLEVEKEVIIDPTDFEKKLFKFVNLYVSNGLKKPDLVSKMEWVLGSCKMS